MTTTILPSLAERELHQAFRGEQGQGKFDLTNLLAQLPSQFIEATKSLMILKPNLKSKTAFIGNICSLCGTGEDPVEDMSFADFQQVCRYLMDPSIAKEHSYGDARIIADLMAGYEQIREQKRRVKKQADDQQEWELKRRQRLEHEEALKLEFTPEKVAENKRLVARMIGSLSDKK